MDLTDVYLVLIAETRCYSSVVCADSHSAASSSSLMFIVASVMFDTQA